MSEESVRQESVRQESGSEEMGMTEKDGVTDKDQRGLFVAPGQRQELAATLTMPYTLTTGLPAGTFLAALGHRILIGSKETASGKVCVPPADGPLDTTFVRVAETGTITAVTVLGGERSGAVALIRLDGTDADLLHRIVVGDGTPAAGARVRAVWAEEPTGTTILDIAGFVLDPDAEQGSEPTPFDPAALEIEAVQQLPYSLQLSYRHSYGPYYGQLFDQVGSSRRILGSNCPHCQHVLVPPRERCEICFSRTERLVDVADTGRLQAFSIIHMEFVGQTRTPPYVYAEIMLDGSATRLIHTLGGVDPDAARRHLAIGARVRAVWKDRADAVGTLDDIDHFALVDPLPEGDTEPTTGPPVAR